MPMEKNATRNIHFKLIIDLGLFKVQFGALAGHV